MPTHHRVDALAAQHVQQGRRGAQLDAHAPLGMVGRQGGQEGREQQVGRRGAQADGQRAGLATVQRLQFTLQLGFFEAHAAGPFGHAGAVRRQADLARAAVQQRQAKLGFQRLDAAAEGWLRPVHLLRRA
ncbi:hypothetical protein G6F68_018706 [Rhizopus microsporus]|nr:hypothetical protein G6F68_018706 [Rhizopus microsporus]